jgi:transposase
MEQQVIGLDVSKAWLDGYAPATGRRLRVSNDPAGIEDLLRSVADPAGCLMVMEASGGYERTAHQALVARGVPAAIVNPSSAERSIRLRSSRRPLAPEDACATLPAAWAWRPRPTGSMPR